MSKDFYATLGVAKNATDEDIKRAYKNLAKKYHPDLNKEAGAEARFKEINEAYSVLSDSQKRAMYDQYGSTGYQNTGGGAAGYDFTDFGADFDPFDIFNSFFGMDTGAGRQQRARRGQDLQSEVELTLEEAFSGIERKLELRKPSSCSSCKGSGAASANDITTCSTCKGSGSMRHQQRTPFGIFQTTTSCSTCGGSGKMIKKPCASCRGRGVVMEEKSLKVKIPAGVEDGNTLRVPGEGVAVKDGISGDLYVVIRVDEDERFERKGNDILSDASISFSQAALGSEIDIETLHGKVKLKIPKGTQPGTTFKLHGKGMPSLNSGRYGEHYVTVNVHVPEKLSRRQEELLLDLAKESGETPPKQGKGLFKKMF